MYSTHDSEKQFRSASALLQSHYHCTYNKSTSASQRHW